MFSMLDILTISLALTFICWMIMGINKGSAIELEAQFDEPYVVGFVVINHKKMIKTAECIDPKHKNIAVVIQLRKAKTHPVRYNRPDVHDLYWRVAITEKHVHRIARRMPNFMPYDCIVFTERRTRWHDKIFAPIIAAFNDGDDGDDGADEGDVSL